MEKAARTILPQRAIAKIELLDQKEAQTSDVDPTIIEIATVIITMETKGHHRIRVVQLQKHKKRGGLQQTASFLLELF